MNGCKRIEPNCQGANWTLVFGTYGKVIGERYGLPHRPLMAPILAALREKCEAICCCSSDVVNCKQIRTLKGSCEATIRCEDMVALSGVFASIARETAC